MSGRCSPTDALNLLIPAFAPMEAAAELTRAVHDNRCRLYCNYVVIPSHIAPRLTVVAQQENDGRWTARIAGTFAMGGVKPTDVWEFEIDEVEALLPQPQPKQKPGPKPIGDWPNLIHRELRRLGRKRVQALQDSGELRPKLESFLEQKIGWKPQDPKPLNTIIRAFLQG